jgi:hypothetical protein
MRYEEMIEVARLCANNARIASTKDAAAVLWRIAREYQEKAAKLDGDKLPDIGMPPRRLVG